MRNMNRGGIFGNIRQSEITVHQVEKLIANLLAEHAATNMPAQRKTITLDAWLDELEMLLRREVWPTIVGIDKYLDIDALAKQIKTRFECATPKQRELWSLLLAAKNLRKLLNASPPDGDAIAIKSMELIAKLSSLPREAMSGNLLGLLKVIAAHTTPEEQQANAEKGTDRAIRKRQKRKADKRKADASANRKLAAIILMFKLVDEAPPEKRMKQIPASKHVWKTKFSRLKDLKVEPGTIRRWYSEEKRRRLKRARHKLT